jgi:hypothetical protein
MNQTDVSVHAQEYSPSHLPEVPQAHALFAQETGGRKFQCIDCDSDDPLRSPEVYKLLTGELRPLDR